MYRVLSSFMMHLLRTFLTAIHGTTPMGVEANMETFCFYFSSTVDVARDKNGKELRATKKEIHTYLKRFLQSYFFAGLCNYSASWYD